MIKNTKENKKSATKKEDEVWEVLLQLNSKLLLIGNACEEWALKSQTATLVAEVYTMLVLTFVKH